MYRLLVLIPLLGCTGKDTDTVETGDSSTDTAVDDTGPEPCVTTVIDIEPVDGDSAVYYREPLLVSFEGDGAAAVFTLTGPEGEVPVIATFGDGNVQASLSAELAALTQYTLAVTICDVVTTSTFSTSSLGTALEFDPAELVGDTFQFSLADATITEPAFLEIVAGSQLTQPILIGVTAASSTAIDLVGGLGEAVDGTYEQLEGLPTWDFPEADFSEQPYFEAESDLVTILYGETPIPIEQFALSGTFTSDGSVMAEGRATGFGDTRYMADLVNRPAEDYGAVCEIAAAAGIYCTECSDGEPYCLYIVAENIQAALVPDLTMEVVE